MSPVSHQTIKLSPGKHYSPDDGACVMELASMLAGEPFNDHPASVCPVLGSVLRSYNDSVDDDARQDLYAYAARVVGTRADADLLLVTARSADSEDVSLFAVAGDPASDTEGLTRTRLESLDLARLYGQSTIRAVDATPERLHEDEELFAGTQEIEVVDVDR